MNLALKMKAYLPVILAGMVCCAHPSHAQQVDPGNAPAAPSGPAGVAKRFPKGSIQSVQAADQALREVARERDAVGKRFAAEEQACYSDFFVNSCREKAQERRRVALKQLHPVEVEANAFKRRAKAQEQDRDLAERNARKNTEPQQRQQEEQSGRQAKASASQPAPVDAPGARSGQSDRVNRHNEKLKRLQTEEEAKEEKRAAKIAAYEKKVREAEARQLQVEKKKQEKERKRIATAEKQGKTSPQDSAGRPDNVDAQEATVKPDSASQQK